MIQTEKMIYPNTIDPEVIPLCDCLNSFDGLETSYSCSGHGIFEETSKVFHIMVRCSTIDAIKKILYVINPQRYSGKSLEGQKGSTWSANAYYGHNETIVVLNLRPLVASTDEAILAANDLIIEIEWLRKYGEI